MFRGLPIVGLLHLMVIWVVWGSTYLAIRVAVREGAGFGPFWLGASRVLPAGAILLAVAAALGLRIRVGRRELAVLATSGVLLWLGGNGGVSWAEQRIDSGLAALVVGTMPMWVAAMEGVLDRRAPSLLLVGSMVSGFAGLAVLTVPMLRQGASADLVGVAAVVFAAVSWGAGSILQNRRQTDLDPKVSSGVQQLVGGVAFVMVALLVAEPAPNPAPEAWAAWGYLVVFGSLLAFTSYVYALRMLPTAVVMTYTYVNPVIAVLLGWIILDEPITGWTAAGTALVLAGVLGVFREKGRRGVER